jgi:hypothetical protein
LNWIQSRLTALPGTVPPGPTGPPHSPSPASLHCLAPPTICRMRRCWATASCAPLHYHWPEAPLSFSLCGHTKPAPTTAPCCCTILKRGEHRSRPLSPFTLFLSRHDHRQRPPPHPGDHWSTPVAREPSTPPKLELPPPFFPLPQ